MPSEQAPVALAVGSGPRFIPNRRAVIETAIEKRAVGDTVFGGAQLSKRVRLIVVTRIWEPKKLRQKLAQPRCIFQEQELAAFDLSADASHPRVFVTLGPPRIRMRDPVGLLASQCLNELAS